jgi:hypothetical protein
VGFYAAGYLEGYTTAASICNALYNVNTTAFGGNGTLRAAALQFLQKVCLLGRPL